MFASYFDGGKGFCPEFLRLDRPNSLNGYGWYSWKISLATGASLHFVAAVY